MKVHPWRPGAVVEPWRMRGTEFPECVCMKLREEFLCFTFSSLTSSEG